MIPYVGDVSRCDAELLRALAECSDRILEFGCGASTQILRAYSTGLVESVDTEPEWIAKTVDNLVRLGIPRLVAFRRYELFKPVPEYDLIFVDGLGELRLPFALATWPALAVGGAMAFHDTRRPADVGKVCALVSLRYSEVDRVVFNQDDSNITVITKRVPLLLEDYNALEGRTPAQLGIA